MDSFMRYKNLLLSSCVHIRNAESLKNEFDVQGVGIKYNLDTGRSKYLYFHCYVTYCVRCEAQHAVSALTTLYVIQGMCVLWAQDGYCRVGCDASLRVKFTQLLGVQTLAAMHMDYRTSLIWSSFATTVLIKANKCIFTL